MRPWVHDRLRVVLLWEITGEKSGVKGKPSVVGRPLTPLSSPVFGRLMNNTKPITSPQSTTNLEALDIALDAAGTAIALVDRVPTKLKSLQDQVIRSASSVPANLAEGHGRVGRDRFHHYRIAYASAKEIDVHIRILAGAGAINGAKAEEALDLFDRVRAMTWRLIHPRC